MHPHPLLLLHAPLLRSALRTATSIATRSCTPSCAPSVNVRLFASFLGDCTALLCTLDPTLVSTHTRSHFNIASTTRRTSMSSAAPATLTSIRTRFTSRTNLTTSRTFIPLAHPSHPLPHWCPARPRARTLPFSSPLSCFCHP